MNTRVEEFLVVKVGDKYWMEEFPPGRSDVSEKGFTDDLFRAYRVKPHKEITLALADNPLDYLRPDMPDWFPDLRSGRFVLVRLEQRIAEWHVLD